MALLTAVDGKLRMLNGAGGRCVSLLIVPHNSGWKENHALKAFCVTFGGVQGTAIVLPCAKIPTNAESISLCF